MDLAPPGRSAPPRTSFATSRPVAILVIFIAAVVFGYFSYGRLPVDLMPELTYPTLTVRTEYPGAAPEEVENDISRPIEEELGVIGGLRRIYSVSRAEVSDVVLEFAWDMDMAEATQDVLERLDLVVLPEEARRPLILHYDPSLDPVMELSLSGEGPAFEGEEGLRRLRRLAELQVERELEPIKGVAAVRVKGGLEEEIHVELDPSQLQRTGLSIEQVIERLAAENINVAGGTIEEGRTEYLVRTLNEYTGLEEIADTVVTTLAGRPVRVRDLGRVVRSHKDRQILTRTNGGESVQLEIYREGDANIVALAKRVRAALGEMDPEVLRQRAAAAAVPQEKEGARGAAAPAGIAERLYREEGVRLQVVADRSRFIESSIREVRNTAVLGGLLAVLVLFLFLGSFRTTAIIACSIPISLLVTFAPLNLLGVSLNIMSLGGLALGIGMLVDSSIVVLESIHRCQEEGDGRVAAAARGTSEVQAAVVASTMTSVAVFLPMVFVEGVAGQAFGDLGLAVVVSLLASMVVALFFIPMLASREGSGLRAAAGEGGVSLLRWAAWGAFRESLRSGRRVSVALGFPYRVVRLLIGLVLEAIGKIALLVFLAVVALVGRGVLPLAGVGLRAVLWLPARLTDLLMAGLRQAYPAFLRGALARPGLVVAVLAACVAATGFMLRDLDSELLPEVHQSEFTVEVSLPVGTPLERTDAVLRPVERAILEERAHIRSLILTVGYDPSQSRRADEGEHTAAFKVLLEPSANPAALEEEVIERLRRRFAEIPDVTARVVRPVLFSSRTPIEVEIQGDDLQALRRYGARAAALLERLPNLADVELALRSGSPEVQIVYDRERLALYGLDIRQVARIVRDSVQGFEATRLNRKDQRIPIVVRLALGGRETVEDVARVVVNPGAPAPVPLGAVARVTLGEGPSEVRRVDGRRVALIRANLGEGSLGSAVAAIRAALESGIEWPAGMGYEIHGQQEEWERSRTSLWLALGLGVFLVYVIMAMQFESLLHPFVIMFSIPLAFVGSVLALWLAGMSLSVVVFLGTILLAGIVVNNAIVLVDYINTLRARGLERREAIVTAGGVRLRPILMTTLTTVLGLLPMALGFGEGAELRTPMAITVISGLLSSTLLTLVIVPVLYDLSERARDSVLRPRAVRAAAAPAPVTGGAADPRAIP